MPNHYHLLLRSVRGNLSKAMQFFGGEYTRRVNLHHRWDGPIFRGRFHSQLITDEQHLRTVVPYIHLNPCRAGLVIHPHEHLWSSHAAYAAISTPPPWLTRERILDLFGSREELLRSTEALRTLREPWDSDLDLDTGFFEGRTFRFDEEKDSIPGPAIDPDAVIQAAERVTGLSRAALITPGEGRNTNPGRRLLAWALRRHSGLPHKAIGVILGLPPTAVAQLLARLRRSGGGSEQIREWTRSIDALLRNR